MRTKFALLIIFLFSNIALAAENCFLRTYVENHSIPLRETTFSLPSGTLVTRLLPTKATNAHLKSLFEFSRENNIVFVKGEAPPSPGTSIFISVSPEAMSSQSALAAHLQSALKDFFGTPVNFDRLPPQSQKMVQKMKENFQTRFINENVEFGNSYPKENMIGIRAMNSENLRVNQVVFHEVTHTTTVRKIFEAFNPPEGKAVQPLTKALAGREMHFRAKTKQSMDMAPFADDYEKYYRSDEVEATLRELAQAKSDGLDLNKSFRQVFGFINTEQKQILQMKVNNWSDMVITRAPEEPELKAGRRQRRIVTKPNANFDIEILVPRNLSAAQERIFIQETLEHRFETLQNYRKSISKRFIPEQPTNP